jgi:hypothetical protein
MQEREFDMTKGVRDFVNETFAQMLPQRAEMGNTAFRKAVMQAAMAQHGISLASAATHYNHSLKTVRSIDAELVEGLGRPDDKKGGRKVIHTVDVIKVRTGEVVAAGISRGAAEKLIVAALGAGKTKLTIREVEAAPESVPFIPAPGEVLHAEDAEAAPAVETTPA